MPLDSFALFIKSKALRFTRLDLLDDLTEAKPFNNIFNPLKYIFVSCHTCDELENIALWKMYASLDRGVRVEFDTYNLFKLTLQPQNLPIHEHEIFDYPKFVWTSLGFAGDINSDYIALASNSLAKVNDKEHDMLISHKEVEYRNDLGDYLNKSISIKSYNPTTQLGKVSLNILDYGFQKTKYWEFQKEFRYLIYTVPFCKNQKELQNFLIENRTLKHTHIYAPLSEIALQNMKVRLSPNASDATKYIVETLIKNVGNQNIEESDLKNTIRC